jgi:uncharacterized membrane protein YccC
MSEHPAARQGIAAAGAALAAAILNLPQPFLTVLAVVLLCGATPVATWGQIASRILWAWIGCAAGVLLIILLPEQPWLALPLFGVLTGGGMLMLSRHHGYGHVLMYGMGICASAPAAAIYPNLLMPSALAHGLLLTIAVLAAAFACPPQVASSGTSNMLPRSAMVIGVAVTLSLIAALLIVPHDVVVMVIATVTTILRLEWPNTPSALREKITGVVIGTVASVVFIILVAGSGNNLAVFLLALGLMVWAFEAGARREKTWAIAFRQAAALFAVAAPMIPAPVQSLAGVESRILAVWGGFVIAVLCYLLAVAAVAPTPVNGTPRKSL